MCHFKHQFRWSGSYPRSTRLNHPLNPTPGHHRIPRPFGGTFCLPTGAKEIVLHRKFNLFWLALATPWSPSQHPRRRYLLFCCCLVGFGRTSAVGQLSAFSLKIVNLVNLRKNHTLWISFLDEPTGISVFSSLRVHPRARLAHTPVTFVSLPVQSLFTPRIMLIIPALLVALILLARWYSKPKTIPAYNGEGFFSFLSDAHDYAVKPISLIRRAQSQCGNIFSIQILTVHNVWLRGNELNKAYLDMPEKAWSFGHGMVRSPFSQISHLNPRF